MKGWRDLLNQKWQGVTEEYGPNSQSVVSAFAVLDKTEWLERVGKPIPKNVQVMVVHSWEEALSVFEVPSNKYEIHGHLLEPSLRCIDVMESDLYRHWWLKAVEDAGDYYSFQPYIPESLDGLRDWIETYLHQFIGYLFAEIIAPEAAGTTYFRELLVWFYDRHFPCGWEGDWPEGFLRVF